MLGCYCDQSSPHILMTSRKSRWRHHNRKQSASARKHWCDVNCDIPYFSVSSISNHSTANRTKYAWQKNYFKRLFLYIKRDFYSNVYAILNRIYGTIWTICAFRLLNPRRWSLAKQSSLQMVENWYQQSAEIQAEAKRDGVITPQNYILNQF